MTFTVVSPIYAAKRHARAVGLTYKQMEDVLDYLCSVGNRRERFFLRNDEMGTGLDGELQHQVISRIGEEWTPYNQGDFVGAEQFGIETITARDFLRRIGEIR